MGTSRNSVAGESSESGVDCSNRVSLPMEGDSGIAQFGHVQPLRHAVSRASSFKVVKGRQTLLPGRQLSSIRLLKGRSSR